MATRYSKTLALRILGRINPRPLAAGLPPSPVAGLLPRFAHFGAFESNLDEAELAEVREWNKSFDGSSLPRGSTTFSRSSGPGGQHVNKTESKATTSWTVKELSETLPKALRAKLRSSRYYTARSDSLSFSAQTERRRASNLDENREKLVEELRRIYAATVPGETDPKKVKKHAEVEKSFHNARIKQKKQQSAKKQFRRSSFSE